MTTVWSVLVLQILINAGQFFINRSFSHSIVDLRKAMQQLAGRL